MKKNFNEFKEYIKGKKTAVVGIGISNTPLIRFLVELGACVTAFDKKDYENISEDAKKLQDLGVKFVLGEDYLDNLNGFEVIFKTPSMRIDSPALYAASKNGAYITSEMQEFVKYCPAKIYGVTGSDGKTTTTTIIYNILKKAGYKTFVGGNIGTPLFSQIESISEKDRVVLELSSFQLMTMTVSPKVAVMTNLSPNHLDMHKSMQEYIEAKKNIMKYQGKDDLLILNKDNEITDLIDKEAIGKVEKFSIVSEICNGAYFSNGNLICKGNIIVSLDEIKLRGMHNAANYLAAFCATFDDVKIEDMKYVAENFAGVEHRCEFVREIEGVKYFNDSIASSPTRTLAGLKAFNTKVILIAGGYDKKIPFEPLADEGYPYIKTLILTGNTKYKIKEAFDKMMKKNNIKLDIIMVDNFQDAIFKAKNCAEKGDIVTLSPACASFDMFPNFEVRGNRFKEIVNNL